MTTATQTKIWTSADSKVSFAADQQFDQKRMRHYLNGKVSVMHCHHYATLFTQLALDADDFGGTDIMVEASCESFWPVLRDYYKKNKIEEVSDRIAIAEQYCSFVGLGQVSFEFSDGSGTATMKHSHVEEGWLKKWGQRNEPVNFMGIGYVKAAWAAIFGKDPSSVSVEETQSIVCGASATRFNINW
jgi:hypothetical protein